LKEKISRLGDAIQIIIDIVVGYGQDSTIGDEHRGGINNPLAKGKVAQRTFWVMLNDWVVE
jgi:hypothetical protein